MSAEDEPRRFLGLDEYDWQYVASHTIVQMPVAFAIVILAAIIAARS